MFGMLLVALAVPLLLAVTLSLGQFAAVRALVVLLIVLEQLL